MYLLALNSYAAEFNDLPDRDIATELPINSLPIWYSSRWLPSQIDDLLQSLAVARYGYTFSNPEAATNVDTNAYFQNAADVFTYLPRATLISFLSPFPNMWIGEGSSAPNTIMRRVSAFELAIAYVGLAGLVIAGWWWRSRLEFWIILIFCLFLIVSQGLVVANIGTLYRFRYGPYTMLVSVGLAGIMYALKDRIQR